MCGIFSFFSEKPITEEFYSKLVKQALKSKHGGAQSWRDKETHRCLSVVGSHGRHNLKQRLRKLMIYIGV